MDAKRFLTNSDETGRFIVKSLVTGVTYYVESIGDSHPADWGDLDPATKKMTGSYGEKHCGCITEDESLITEENGFKNIEMLGVGVSPMSEIEARDKAYEQRMKKHN